MDPISAIVVGVLVLVPILGIRYALHQRTLQTWRAAADRLGMQLLSVSDGLSHPRLSGMVDGFTVIIEVTPGRRQGRRTGISVVGGTLQARLELRSESLGTTITKLVEGNDIQTGDPEFDAAVLVRGDPHDIALVLGRNARSRVMQALREGARVERGQIVMETRGSLRDADTLVAKVRDLVDLASALRLPRDAPGRLAEWVTRDPCPQARLRFLAVLSQHHASDPRTRPALLQAQQDPSPEVRLAAAIACEAQGRATLASLLADEATPEETACRAAAELGGGVEPMLALGVLNAALARQRQKLARSMIEILPDLGDSRATKRLIEVLDEPTLELARAAAVALGDCRTTAAEAALVAALSSELSDLRIAAARSLGKVGTVDAVAPLRTAVAAHPLDLSLRSAVTASVNAIQGRAPDASPGQLSLTEGAPGHVSLVAPDIEGRMTLSPSAGEPPTAADSQELPGPQRSREHE